MIQFVTTMNVYKSKYRIVKRDDYYLAINENYIDEDGTLLYELNGIDMFANRSLSQCIIGTLMYETVNRLLDAGYTMEEAMNRAIFLIEGHSLDDVEGIKINKYEEEY